MYMCVYIYIYILTILYLMLAIHPRPGPKPRFLNPYRVSFMPIWLHSSLCRQLTSWLLVRHEEMDKKMETTPMTKMDQKMENKRQTKVT